jgi:hypothetical protein
MHVPAKDGIEANYELVTIMDDTLQLAVAHDATTDRQATLNLHASGCLPLHPGKLSDEGVPANSVEFGGFELAIDNDNYKDESEIRLGPKRNRAS